VRSASTSEPVSAAQSLAAIDGLEAEVDARLRALQAALPSARGLCLSLLSDHARFKSARAALRRRLRLPAAGPAGGESSDASLDGLRAAQQALVNAHAEGLWPLQDARAVDVLARHMVELARQLAVIDLWIEQEQPRG
jgi:hypothetical protein